MRLTVPSDPWEPACYTRVDSLEAVLVHDSSGSSILRFGIFELDANSGELRRHGRGTRLQDKPLQLLVLLLERPGELISRDEIRERIWGASRFYDFDDSLNQAVGKLREALGDSASNPRFVETIPRRGYRFIAPVDGAPAKAPAARSVPTNVPKRPGSVVGRNRALAFLQSALDRAAAGQGSMICLAGEPGIGKTTALDVFLSSVPATRPECVIAQGRCSERLAGEEAYLPLLEALEVFASGPSSLLQKTAPLWQHQLAPAAEPSGDLQGTSQARLKRELFGLFQAASKSGPILLFLDDLHWADISTIDMLSYVGMRSGDLRLLIVGTYRPSDLAVSGNGFQQVRMELESRDLYSEMSLDLLSFEEVAEYVAREFPRNEFSPDFPAFLHACTEGHPLFLVNLLRDFQQRELIVRNADSWTLHPAALSLPLEVPRSVAAMIQRKIDRLQEEEKRLLLAASLMGTRFDAAIVAEIACTAASEVETRMAALEQVHQIVRLEGEHLYPDLTFTCRYVFSHALYQNAVYETLTPTQRAAQSAAAARALLARYGDRTAPIASDLARLFEMARDYIPAAGYFLAAAHNAASKAANQEAAKVARHAIDCAARAPGAGSTDILLHANLFLGQLFQNTGRHAEAIAAFKEAESIAVAAGNLPVQVEAICGQATALFWQKRVPEMDYESSRAIRTAIEGGDTRGAALAEVTLARQQICVGDLDAAAAGYGRAVPVLEASGFSFQATEAAVFQVMLHMHRLEFDRARDASERWLEQAREAGLPAFKHHFFFGMALANEGRLSDALDLLEAGVRAAELNDDRYYACRLYNTIGWVRHEAGDFEAAEKLSRMGAQASREIGNGEAEFNSYLNLARGYIEAGCLSDAWDLLQLAGPICEGEVWFRWRFRIRFRTQMAHFCLAKGDSHAAENHAREAFQLAHGLKVRKGAAWALKLMGDSAAMQDCRDDAVRLYGQALEVVEAHRCPTIEWKIWKALSDALQRLDRTADADRACERSRQVAAGLAASIRDSELRGQFTRRVLTFGSHRGVEAQ